MVDESTGGLVLRWLRAQGHDASSPIEGSPGERDLDVLRRAAAEDRIVITNDKDFGELVFRHGHAHRGVILLRLADDRPQARVVALKRLFEAYPSGLPREFVVVGDGGFRFASMSSD